MSRPCLIPELVTWADVPVAVASVFLFVDVAGLLHWIRGI